jgi:hypothetical protein
MSSGLVERVQALGAAASSLLAVDLTALSDAALVEAVKALRPVICQVQAAETRLVGAPYGTARHWRAGVGRTRSATPTSSST